MALTVKKVTEEDVQVVDLSLQKAPISLRMASISLKSCFHESLADVREFIELRDEVHKGAMVFKDGLLPMSETVVMNMKDFFEYYVVLSEDLWRDSLDTIIADAKEYHLKCSALADAYTVFLADLKKLAAPAKEIQAKLGLDAKEFEQKALAAKTAAEKKEGWAGGFNIAANIMVVIPPAMPFGFLAKFIAHKVTESADSSHAEAVANKGQAEIALQATVCVGEMLIPAIEQFTAAMTDIAGFFNVLSLEVVSFKERGNVAKDDPKRVHYIMMKAKAKDLMDKCKLFAAVGPAFKSDLDAIPPGRSVNWVAEWLTEKRAGKKSLYDSFKGVGMRFSETVGDELQRLQGIEDVED